MTAQQEREEAAAAAERSRALNHDLSIYPESIAVVKGGHDFGSNHLDAPYEDKDTFVFLVRNEGSRTVSSSLADATLTNQGGEVLYEGRLNDAAPLAPGAENRLAITTNPYDISALPNPQLVRQANINDAVVHYTVQRIEYNDGSTITRNQ